MHPLSHPLIALALALASGPLLGVVPAPQPAPKACDASVAAAGSAHGQAQVQSSAVVQHGGDAATLELLARQLARLSDAAPETVVADGTSSTCISITTGDGGDDTTNYVITTRDGKPWLEATRGQTRLFSGPIGTAAERALIPEELIVGARGLGLGFDVDHRVTPAGEQLHVRAGDGEPLQNAQ